MDNKDEDNEMTPEQIKACNEAYHDLTDDDILEILRIIPNLKNKYFTKRLSSLQ